MKEYIVVCKCNEWAHYEKLEDKYRKVYTAHFKQSKNLVDLINKLHTFLAQFDNGFYPEIISITEV